jgi:nitrogenase molybdenum-iron protein alpha/beta subunit
MRVKAFAEAVGLPVIASIPRSEDFAAAEKNGCTLIEFNPDSGPVEIFSQLADYVERLAAGSAELHPALPLEDREMEAMVLGKNSHSDARHYSLGAAGFRRKPSAASQPLGNNNVFLTKSMKHRQPLKGCSFAGAVTATSQVTDALTIAHGPRSCSHIVSHFLTSTSLSASSRYGTPLPADQHSIMLSTDMGERSFIFGGTDELRSSLEAALNSGWDTVFIVTTCPPGLIGDDTGHLICEMKRRYPGKIIIPIPVDGNIAGDFAQGLVEGYRKALELVDDSVLPEDGWVNIVGEKVLSANAGFNYAIIMELLEKIGLKVNCRLLSRTTTGEIVNFRRAQLNLLARSDDSGKVLQDYLESELGSDFFGLPFPVGFRETAEWLELLAERFSAEDAARELINSQRSIYNLEISRIRPSLKGKKVLISSFSPDVDWLLETAFDFGMHVIKVGLAVSPDSVDFRSRYVGLLPPLEYDYGADKRERDIVRLAPDLVLSNYMPLKQDEGVYHDSIPISPDVGFMSGLVMAQRWNRILRLPAVEGWKYDGGDNNDT